MAILLGALWYFTVNFLNAIEIGPNPAYTFSPNYIMVKGHLYFYPDPSDYDHFEIPLEEYMQSFSVEQGWLLGKTEKGYFAINMQNNNLYYPVSSKQELAALTDLTRKPEDWADSYEKQMNSKY